MTQTIHSECCWRGRLRVLVLFAAAMASHSVLGASEAVVGVVTLVEGEVTLVRSDDVYGLELGVDLYEDDIVKSGDGARSQLEMEDGTVLDVGPTSTIYLSQYQLDESGAVTSAIVSVVTGFLRFATGALKPKRTYQFNTSVVSIGIRGTEGVIEVSDDTSSLLLEEGRVEMSSVDAAGDVSDAVTVDAGEFASRRQGQRLERLASAPTGYSNRLPKHLRERARAKRALLTRRGVKAKRLRKATFEDVGGLMKSNPRIRQHLKKRFDERMKDPVFRNKVKTKLSDTPSRTQKQLPVQKKKKATKKALKRRKATSAKKRRGELRQK